MELPVRFHVEPAAMKTSAFVLYFSPPSTLGTMEIIPLKVELFFSVMLMLEMESTEIFPVRT